MNSFSERKKSIFGNYENIYTPKIAIPSERPVYYSNSLFKLDFSNFLKFKIKGNMFENFWNNMQVYCVAVWKKRSDLRDEK